MGVLPLSDGWQRDIWLLQKALDMVTDPFRLGLVAVQIDEGLRSWPDRVVVVELTAFPDTHFKTVVDFNMDNREEIAIDLALQVQHQINQQYVQPEAHIYLGQE